MLKKLQERRESEDRFTLIELMVVVLIIAILIAIAVPTFLGARERAQDRAVQSNLRNSLTASKVLYADSGDYSGVSAASLGNVEPALAFVAGNVASTDSGIVSAEVSGGNLVVTIAALSDSGDCFYIRDNIGDTVATAGTTFGTRAQGAAGNCQGDDVSNVTFNAAW